MDPRAARASADDVVFVDVREPYEWKAGHIDGSKNIPLGELPARADELHACRVVTVCTVGARSEEASRFLRAFGVDAENMEGGVVAWTQAGFELVTPDGRPGRVMK